MKQTTKQSGFTLVELAIVLVIIGLIVGGVLVGQEMIKAAELRAAVTQFDKLDTAVNVFRGKYNGIPGDIQSPATFGFQTPSVTTSLGNGVLDGGAAGRFDSEPGLFFGHLSTANLIAEQINPTTAQVTTAGMATSMATYFPLSKLGKGIYILAHSNSGVNYFLMNNGSIANTGVVTAGITALSPIVSYNLDSKYDDGVPTTGKLIAAIDAAGTTTGLSAAGQTACYDTTPATPAYSIATQANADAGRCALRIRASF